MATKNKKVIEGFLDYCFMDKMISKKDFNKLYTYKEIKLLFSKYFSNPSALLPNKELRGVFYNWAYDIYCMHKHGQRVDKTSTLRLYKLLVQKIDYENLPIYLYIIENSDSGAVIRWRMEIKK